MDILILANGDPPSATLTQRLAGRHDVFIAADGAAERAASLGVVPDIVCGDFDSINLQAARMALPKAEFVSTPDQNAADLEKALDLAIARGATSITIIGAAGGRIDHTLANFALLVRYSAALPISIVDDTSQVWAVTGAETAVGAFTFATVPGDTVSLITQGGGTQFSIHGVAWEVRAFELAYGTRGVSNVATGNRVTVEVHRGAVLLCHLYPVGSSTGYPVPQVPGDLNHVRSATP